MKFLILMVNNLQPGDVFIEDGQALVVDSIQRALTEASDPLPRYNVKATRAFTRPWFGADATTWDYIAGTDFEVIRP